jgi:hypothetical protein
MITNSQGVKPHSNPSSSTPPPAPAAAPPAAPGCTHFTSDYFQVRGADGLPEVEQRCVHCGRKMRGRGVVVPAAELARRGIRPITRLLPVAGPREGGTSR